MRQSRTSASAHLKSRTAHALQIFADGPMSIREKTGGWKAHLLGVIWPTTLVYSSPRSLSIFGIPPMYQAQEVNTAMDSAHRKDHNA